MKKTWLTCIDFQDSVCLLTLFFWYLYSCFWPEAKFSCAFLVSYWNVRHAFPLYNLDCVTCINLPFIALGIYFWFNAEGLWFQCQNASMSSYECLKLFPVTRPAQGNLKNRQTRQPLLISWDESDFGHTILLIHCIYLYPKRLISLIGWWDTFCTKDRTFENFITQAITNSKKNHSGCAWLWLSE